MQLFLSVWRDFYRQKTSLFFSILFPVVMVFLLGSLLEQVNVAEYKIPVMHIAYISEQKDEAFEQYITTMENKGLLKVNYESDLKTGLLKLGTEYCAIVENNNESKQMILHQGGDKTSARALHILMQSYISTKQAVSIIYENGGTIDTSTINKDTDYVKTKKLGVERSMIDYYAVTMIVMIFFMAGAIGSASCFQEFRKEGLQDRVALTPTKKIKVFFMIMLGNLPMSLMELFSIMFCSAVFFGAKYAQNLFANIVFILYFILVALVVNAIGAVIGIFLKVDAVIVIMPIGWIMLFFGGSFSNNVDLGMVTKLMPPHIVQQAVFDLTLFGNYERIIYSGIVMAVILAVTCSLGAYLFSRQKKN